MVMVAMELDPTLGLDGNWYVKDTTPVMMIFPICFDLLLQLYIKSRVIPFVGLRDGQRRMTNS
jgi:hypothetical protein